MSNHMKMGYLQNIQSFETGIETGNLQNYDEQTINQFYSHTSKTGYQGQRSCT